MIEISGNAARARRLPRAHGVPHRPTQAKAHARRCRLTQGKPQPAHRCRRWLRRGSHRRRPGAKQARLHECVRDIGIAVVLAAHRFGAARRGDGTERGQRERDRGRRDRRNRAIRCGRDRERANADLRTGLRTRRAADWADRPAPMRIAPSGSIAAASWIGGERRVSALAFAAKRCRSCRPRRSSKVGCPGQTCRRLRDGRLFGVYGQQLLDRALAKVINFRRSLRSPPYSAWRP